MPKVVLTGSTGAIGGSVLRHILNKNLIPTSDLIISLYNPSTAPKHITDSNIPLRRGDFTDPSTLQTAFEGADILFLVSYPGFSGITDLRIKSHAAAIDAAKKAGIKRIVYTSLSFGGKSGHDTTAVVAHAHIATAKLLRECGLEYTILREAPYAETWNLYAGLLPSKVLKTTGDVDMVVPSDVSARFCAREDLGEASAKVLEKIWSNPESFKNESIVLQSSYATSISDIAHLFEKQTGRKVHLRILPESEVVAYHLEKQSLGPGTTKAFLLDWLTFFTAMAAGDADYVDDSIEEVLSRKARGIKDMADELFTANRDDFDYYFR